MKFITLLIAMILGTAHAASLCGNEESFRGTVTKLTSGSCKGMFGVDEGAKGVMPVGLPGDYQKEGLSIDGCGVPSDVRPCDVSGSAWDFVIVTQVQTVGDPHRLVDMNLSQNGNDACSQIGYSCDSVSWPGGSGSCATVAVGALQYVAHCLEKPKESIQGTVVSLGPTVGTTVSEHAPQWEKAVVRNDSGNMETEIWFASSWDVAWFNSPKLVVGVHATFAPETNTSSNNFGLPVGAFYVPRINEVTLIDGKLNYEAQADAPILGNLPRAENAQTFTKVSGPAWLQVGSTGILGGTPSAADVGLNSFVFAASSGMKLFIDVTVSADPCAGVKLPPCPPACPADFWQTCGTPCSNEGDVCGNNIGDGRVCEHRTYACVVHAPLGQGCNLVCR